MKYSVSTAFFAVGFDANRNPPFRTVLETVEQSTVPIPMFLVLTISGGIPHANDRVNIAVLVPGDRNATHGPEAFQFDAEGTRKLMFPFDRLPLDETGPVSAQLRFEGDAVWNHVCGFHVVPVGTLAHQPTTSQ